MNNKMGNRINNGETTGGNSSVRQKLAIAATLLFALGAEAAETATSTIQDTDKTKTETTTENSSTSPITENIEELSIIDYITYAEKNTIKYYPKRENYFSGMFNYIKDKNGYYSHTFNKIISSQLNKAKAKKKINTEQDVTATVLFALEELFGKNEFAEDPSIKIIDFNEIEDVRQAWGKIIAKKTKKELKDFQEKMETISENLAFDKTKDMQPIDIINNIETYLIGPLEPSTLKYYDSIKGWIETYITLNNRIGNQPSEKGYAWINEFQKINDNQK